MKNYKIKISSIAAAAIFLSPFLFSSCGNKEAPPEEHHDESATTVVELTADQQKAIGLQFDTITYRNLSTSLKVNGTLQLPPQNKAQVSVLAGGVVNTI